MSLALAILLPVAATLTPSMVCQTDLPRIDGRVVAWFNLMADDGLRAVSSDVFMRTGEFDAQWRVDGKGLGAPGAMFRFRAALPLETLPQAPVTLTVVNDPGTAVRPPRYSSEVTPGKSSRGGWEIVATEKLVPNIFGKRVSLVISDASGREVLRRVLAHPDWRWFEAEAAKAGAESEAKRLRGQCLQSIVE